MNIFQRIALWLFILISSVIESLLQLSHSAQAAIKRIRARLGA
jgi:hypothetical protein